MNANQCVLYSIYYRSFRKKSAGQWFRKTSMNHEILLKIKFNYFIFVDRYCCKDKDWFWWKAITLSCT